MALRPDLPLAVGPGNAEQEVSPHAFRSLLERVPTGVEGTATLLDAIRRLNRVRLTAEEREACLAAAQPLLESRLQALTTHQRAHRFPLPPRSREVIRMALSLRAETALGHLTLAVEAESTADTARILRASVAALRLWNQHLLRTAQLYQTPGNRFWHNVHAAYALAERIASTDRCVDGLSPAEAYKRILLFATGHGQALGRADAEHVAEWLTQWAHVSRLHADAGGAGRHAFGVDLGRAAGPRRLALLEPAQPGDLRVLEVEAVVAEAARSARIGGRKRPHGPSRHALSVVLGHWRQQTLRRRTRKPHQRRADVEVGLRAIRERVWQAEHKAATLAQGEGSDQPPHDDGNLSIARDADELRDPYADFVSHPQRAGSVQRDDVWSRSLERRTSAYYRGQSAVEAAGLQQVAANPGRAWQLNDLSARGFGLEWIGTGDSNATVGEVVAMSVSRDGNEHWWLGTIRWLRAGDDSRFKVGVQVIARHAWAARVWQHDETGRPATQAEEPGLLFAAGADGEEPDQILLPASMFDVGDTLELGALGREWLATLGPIHEETGSFAWFDITLSEPPSGDPDVERWEIL